MALIGEAFVRVLPELGDFVKVLVASINKFPPVPVKVAPLTTGFRTLLAADLKKMAPVPVPVIPTLAPGSRAALLRELESRAAIPIKGVIAPTVAAAAVTSGVTTPAVVTAAATTAPAAAGLEVTTTATEKLSAEEKQLLAIQKALNTQIARNTSLETLLKSETLTVAEAVAALDVATKSATASQKLFADSLLTVNAELRLSLENAAAAAAATKAFAATQVGILSGTAAADAAVAAERLAGVENLVRLAAEKTAAVTDSLSVETLKLAEAQGVATEASAALAAAQKATDAAIALGDPVLISATADTYSLATAQKTQAEAAIVAAQTAEIAAAKQATALKTQIALSARQAEQAAKTEATVLRGAGATGLAAGGLRGATLAASSAFLVGAAAVTVLLKSLQAAGQFERQLNVLQAAAHATDGQMRELSAVAISLGKDLSLPAVSSKDAAVALTDLATAGFSVQQSIQAVRGALLLGVAAQIDTAQATDITVKTLDSFHLAGDQSIRVADSLTNAARAAEGNIADFANALAQIGPVAKQGGLSLEDTTAILTVFAKGGLSGAAAGTALRQALVRLENPTNAAAALLKLLNINIRDVQGNLRPDLFIQIGEAANKFGPAFRDAAFATLFGARAVKAADIAFQQGILGLIKAQQEQKNIGATAVLAAAQTKGLSGRFEELKKTVTTISVDLGNLTKGPVSGIVSGFTSAIRRVDQLTVSFKGLSGHLSLVSEGANQIAKTFSAGILPLVGIVAITKLYAAVVGVVTAAHARWIGTSAKLVAAQTALATAEAKAVAATQALAIAQTEAEVTAAQLVITETAAAVAVAEQTVAAETAAAANRTLTASLTSVLGKWGLLAVAAIGIGIAIRLLGRHVSDTKKATDELAASAQHLASAFNAENLILERKALEDLAAALERTARIQTDIQTRGVATRAGLVGQKTGTAAEAVAQQKASEAAHRFVLALRAQANAVKDFQPLLAHNRNLLADFVRLLGRIPTQKEISIFVTNQKTSTSLSKILDQVKALGGQAAIDAEEVGARIAEGVGKGLDLRIPDAIKSASPNIARTAAGLGKELFEAIALSMNTKTGATKNIIQKQISGIIDLLVSLGPAGFNALKGVGAQLMDGLVAGITQNQKEAIAAANQAFQDAVDQANEQVRAAVSSAKSNLGSMAQSLASAVGSVLDARAQAAIAALDKSALGREIQALQKSLDQTNLKAQRAELVLTVGQATDESSRRHALFQLRQFDLQTKLDTDKKKLASEKDTIQKTADAQKLAVQKNIQAYADAFAKGQISVAEFGKKVLGQIKAAIPDFDTAGKSMAATFQPVQEILDGIILQAKELAGFTGIAPGGTNQQNIIKITKIAADAQRSIADALKVKGESLAKINAESRGFLEVIAKAMLRISPETGPPSTRNSHKSHPQGFQATPDVSGDPLKQAAKVRG